jgi:hypothetical protein
MDEHLSHIMDLVDSSSGRCRKGTLKSYLFLDLLLIDRFFIVDSTFFICDNITAEIRRGPKDLPLQRPRAPSSRLN